MSLNFLATCTFTSDAMIDLIYSFLCFLMILGEWYKKHFLHFIENAIKSKPDTCFIEYHFKQEVKQISYMPILKRLWIFILSKLEKENLRNLKLVSFIFQLKWQSRTLFVLKLSGKSSFVVKHHWKNSTIPNLRHIY